MINIGIIGTIYNKISDILNIYPSKQDKKTVVVVGYGWGGKAFCDTINHRKYDITVISKTDYMLNTPKLKDSVFGPINSYKNLYIDRNKPNDQNHRQFKFIQDEVKDVRELRQKYDYVVLAPGSVPNDFGIPGVKENCYFFKTIDDCANLKGAFDSIRIGIGKKWLGSYDTRVVIAGAGPAGIELAFELSKYCNVSLIEAAPNILPNFSDSMRESVLQELKRNNILLFNKTVINKVEPGRLFSKENNDSMYLYDIAIWNCGVKPNPIISQLTDQRALPVDGKLHFQDNIYGLGDIIASKSHGPPTAQNARQQGLYLAQLFNNNFEGADYTYKEKGKIIHTQDYILIEFRDQTIKLPRWLESVVDFIVENL